MPRRDEAAAYHVQLRDAERRILQYAIYNNDMDFVAAANSLGITKRWMLLRAHQLGGVFQGEPRLEPPPSVWGPSKSKPAKVRKLRPRKQEKTP